VHQIRSKLFASFPGSCQASLFSDIRCANYLSTHAAVAIWVPTRASKAWTSSYLPLTVLSSFISCNMTIDSTCLINILWMVYVYSFKQLTCWTYSFRFGYLACKSRFRVTYMALRSITPKAGRKIATSRFLALQIAAQDLKRQQCWLYHLYVSSFTHQPRTQSVYFADLSIKAWQKVTRRTQKRLQ
jgi:hypothetical protein